jgi:hypothetical protein
VGRLALLLKHFSELGDIGEPWRIVYPLKEGGSAGGDLCHDRWLRRFDDIIAWGEEHLNFQRRFSVISVKPERTS